MMQYAWLALEAQQVIALRMMKLAMGGPAAALEAQRMITEKLSAATMATAMVYCASASGATDAGCAAVVRMLRREVRANRKRLGGC